MLAGRLLNGLIPDCKSNKIKVVAVLHEEELKEFSNQDVNYLSYNVNDSFKDQTWITFRRLAVMIFAEKCELSNFIMIDDNIKEVLFKKQFTCDDKLDQFGWSDFYINIEDICLREKCLLIGMDNTYGYNSIYPSKFFFFNAEKIFNILRENELKVNDLFPDINNKDEAFLPLEDYYMHFALMFLYNIDSRNKEFNINNYIYKCNRLTTCSYVKSSLGNIAREVTNINKLKAQDWEKISISDYNQNISTIRSFCLNLIQATVSLAVNKKTAFVSYWNLLLDKFFSLNKIRHENQFNLSSEILNEIYKKLRLNQKKACDGIIQYIDNNECKQNIYEYSFGAVHMCTGSGKSYVIFYTALHFIIKEKTNVFILAPTQELVNQLFNSFKEMWIKIDKIESFPFIKVMSGANSIPEQAISMEMIDNVKLCYIFCTPSLKSLISNCNSFEFKNKLSQIPRIIDESHIYFNNKSSAIDILSYYRNVLLSGTPYKYKSQNYIYSFSKSNAIAQNYIPEVKIIKLNISDDNDIINILKKEKGKGMVVLGQGDQKMKELGKKIENELENNERKVYLIHSSLLANQGKDIIQEIKENRKAIILVHKMLRLGFDMPDLEFIIDTQKRTNYRTQKQCYR